jgi:hypothetical protein
MTDWITATGDTTEADAARANRAVDYLISGAVYVADSDGAPSNSRQREACETAARLIADHFTAGGDEGGAVSIGSLQLSATDTTSVGSGWGDAVRVLRGAGLGWVVN